MSQPESINPETGLTQQEDVVYSLSASLFNQFSKLPVQHPDDVRECCDAIHTIQRLLATRIARRNFSEGWPQL